MGPCSTRWPAVAGRCPVDGRSLPTVPSAAAGAAQLPVRAAALLGGARRVRCRATVRARRGAPNHAVPRTTRRARARPRAAGNRPALGTATWRPARSRQVVAGCGETCSASADRRAHDNFFELGGHSLLATRFVARLRDPLGVGAAAGDGLRDTDRRRDRGRAPETGAGPATAAPQPAVPQPTPSIPRADGGRRAGPALLRPAPAVVPRPARTSRPLHRADRVAARREPRRRVLRAALANASSRHESLRTVFPSDGDGDPVQRVLPTGADLPIAADGSTYRRPCPSSRGATGGPGYAALAAESDARSTWPSGPLFRAGCCCGHRRDRHVLSLTMHHTVSDGWSLGVLIAASWPRSTTRSWPVGPPRCPSCPSSTRDYARWQRAAGVDGRLREQLALLARAARRGGRRRWSCPPTGRARPCRRFRGAVGVRSCSAAADRRRCASSAGGPAPPCS